jgi:DNA repair exonuclease SbcCD nuclease subunit
MSKFALISDLHITWDTPVGRKDNFVGTQERKLDSVFSYCSKNMLPLLCAADVFDSPRSWRAYDMFLSILNRYPGVQFYSIAGQHDIYYRSSDVESVSLKLLAKSGKLQLLSSEPTKIGDAFVYGVNYIDEEIPTPKDIQATNILVIHRMITDRPLWANQQDFTDAAWFLSKYGRGYSVILCGDAHRKFLIQNSTTGKVICNTGPLLRAEASEEMFLHEPCFYVWDSETMKIEEIEIPHEDADKVLSRKHIEWTKEKSDMMNEFVQMINETELSGVSFTDNLQEYIKANNISPEVQKIITDVMEEVDQK